MTDAGGYISIGENKFIPVAQRHPSASNTVLGPQLGALSRPFFGWEVLFSTKQDDGKKLVPTYSHLSTGPRRAWGAWGP